MLSHTDSVTALRGIGAQRAKLLARLHIHTIGDLLYHFPRGYQNRGNSLPLSATKDGQLASLCLVIGTTPKVSRLPKRLTLLQFRAFDQSGTCTVTYFGQTFLEKEFSVGKCYRFYGKVKKKGNRYELTSPAYEPMEEGAFLPDYYAIHKKTDGLFEKQLRTMLEQALDQTDFSAWEPLPASLLQSLSLPDLATAFRQLHFPTGEEALFNAQRRFAFEELFLFSLALCGEHEKRKQGKAPALSLSEAEQADFLGALPYSLTGAQKRSVAEILADLRCENGVPMARLLNGDVGSGKTICAALAAYACARRHHQCAFMAPTEILARQHYADLSPLFARFGIRVALLCGAMTPKQKHTVTEALAQGKVDLVIGTHALLTDTVRFQNLGLVITDEQHRFGVFARTALSEKGTDPHLLVMSATPIPRTLALILYGDLAVSTLDELPPGRQTIDTYCVDSSYRARLDAFLEKQVAQGGQAYVVCPAIEETDTEEETLDLTPALRPIATTELTHVTSYATALQQRLPQCRVGVLHGKQSARQKEESMQAFATGQIDILVCTTVVEVGVNVPNATLMLIENAERFGLSALHQLRGRVGRGTKKSYCVLVKGKTDSETAHARLQVLCRTQNGYEIAKEDLALRGPGDFFPREKTTARQHGAPQFRMASLCEDLSLLTLAQQCAKEFYAKDPSFSTSPNTKKALQTIFAGSHNTFH